MNYNKEYYQFLLLKVKVHFKKKELKDVKKNINNIKKNKKPDLNKILEFHDIYVQTCQSPNIKLRNTFFPDYLNHIKKRLYYTLKSYIIDYQNEDEINNIMNLIDYYAKNISKHNLETLIHHFHLVEN